MVLLLYMINPNLTIFTMQQNFLQNYQLNLIKKFIKYLIQLLFKLQEIKKINYQEILLI